MNRIHGGNVAAEVRRSGTADHSLFDFSASINPLGPPSWFRQLVNRNLETVGYYPDPESQDFRQAAARFHGVPAERIVTGNGASEIIFALPRIRGVQHAIIPCPAYGDYRHACLAAGVTTTMYNLNGDESFRLDFDVLESHIVKSAGARLIVWLGQPGNPTGIIFDSDRLSELCRKHSDCIFAVDESFADFVEGYTSFAEYDLPNAVVIRSLTKFYAVPGLRIGYAVTSPDLCDSIEEILPTWSVNTLAQVFAARALTDTEFRNRSLEFVTAERRRLISLLRSVPDIDVCEGEANFLLIRIRDLAAAEAKTHLLADGLLVRTCDDFSGLDDRYIRVAVRTEEENDRLYTSLMKLFSPERPVEVGKRRPRAARLMLQGTASNAGKSILTAAFCRILLQDGIRVAPFKAQNMSLNSFVTADGGEMGRAQVVQAQACRIEPDVRMNPVLLKPSSNTGSQVILCGKPIAFMEAKKYHTDKTRLIREVTRCFDEMADEYDAVVLEGAGSPGEVNLKQYDIVNMKMAAYAKAPVLLVGDIDRGGVFAAFVGTLDVLDEWERGLIQGFLINKFRGDSTLLESAISYTSDYTGKPTFGIIPMIPDLGVPDEDSVSFKSEPSTPQEEMTEETVKIGLVDLPHISNFTDFDPLKNEPDVSIQIIRRVDDLDDCDALIIPGSKNVIADLHYLEESGIAARILQRAYEKNFCTIGICGGYQMLGRSIADPGGVESDENAVEGLCLLELETVLGKNKILEQTVATHIVSGAQIRGYEIHHGRTSSRHSPPWIERSDGEIIGVSHPELSIHGTYLHGLFDGDVFRRWFIDSLRVARGLPRVGQVLYVHEIETALDRLADIVRNSVDLDSIYAVMGL